MQETQKYLNDILKKRLGSVVNYGGSSKAGITVARIPKQQQRIQTMPTVFRKKHQTIYKHDDPSQIHSQYFSMKGNQLNTHGPGFDNIEMPEQNRQKSNQRVEYMLISKRIQSKQQQYISPTVDVTKYNTNKETKSIGLNNRPLSTHSQISNYSTGTTQSKRKRIFQNKNTGY